MPQRVAANDSPPIGIGLYTVADAALLLRIPQRIVRRWLAGYPYKSRDGERRVMPPLWQPQLLWLIGLVLFSLIATAYAIHALLLLARGSPQLNRFYGPASAQDELEAELAARAERAGQANNRAGT